MVRTRPGRQSLCIDLLFYIRYRISSTHPKLHHCILSMKQPACHANCRDYILRMARMRALYIAVPQQINYHFSAISSGSLPLSYIAFHLHRCHESKSLPCESVSPSWQRRKWPRLKIAIVLVLSKSLLHESFNKKPSISSQMRSIRHCKPTLLFARLSNLILLCSLQIVGADIVRLLRVSESLLKQNYI